MAEPTDDSSPIAEISHGPSGFESFLEKYQKLLIVVGILLAIGIATFVIMREAEEGKARVAGEALVAAGDIDAMETVSAEYPRTPSAASAAVRRSDLQWRQGQQTAALETLRNVIADHPEHPVVPPARARLGARLMEQGNLDDASGAFEALRDSVRADYLAPYAMASLAEIARQRGDTEEAKELLADAGEQYPASPFNQVINSYQRFVTFEMPAEVDPPEPAAGDTSGGGLSRPPGLSPDGPAAPNLGGNANPLLDNFSEGADTAPPEDSPPEKRDSGNEAEPAEDNEPAAEEPAQTDNPSGATGGERD